MNMTSLKSEDKQPFEAPVKNRNETTRSRFGVLFYISRQFLKIWIKIFKFSVLTLIEILRTILFLDKKEQTKK